jgi:ribosomal protein L13E
MQRLLDQINSRFDFLSNKIEKLEAEMQKSSKPSPKPKTVVKDKVEENT